MAQKVKNPPGVQETWVWSLGWEDPPEKGMVTHSSILAWRIPWTEGSGPWWGSQSMGSQRVGHDWVTQRNNRQDTQTTDCWEDHVKSQQGERPREKPNLGTPWPWTTSLQNCGKINVSGLSHPACAILLWRPSKARGEGDDKGWDD